MTNQHTPMTVEEGNRLIAESPFASDAIKISLAKADHHGALAVFYKELKYHSSDDWLMPVIRKIAHWVLYTDFGSIKKLNAAIEAWKPLSNSLEKAEDIPVLYTHVVNFIRWYNTQTSKQ